MEKQFMYTINDIDFTLPYEGYLWMSNEHESRLFKPEAVVGAQLFSQRNLFVVEGYLYHRATGVSLSIKYVDGQYLVYQHKVEPSDEQHPDVDHIKYLTLRMSGSPTLWAKFLRYWKEKPNDECLGMGVLEVEKEVFVGFSDKEDL